MVKKNYDQGIVDDFGDEWEIYDHSSANFQELEKQFFNYFNVFPWSEMVVNGVGADIGCGTGRWARFVADKVNLLICLDASDKVAKIVKRNTSDKKNCHVVQGRVDALPFLDSSLDFAYSLGVLHHLPNTLNAIKKCTKTLKPGAPFLLYLYYAFDNRPKWYLFVWKCSEFFRKIISRSPFFLKYCLSNIIAVFIYLPLARFSLFLEKMKINVSNIPLSHYRAKSFYTLRTDSLDRFGTKLEHRFTKNQIKIMMEDAGLVNIKFSNLEPYWCVVGTKSP